MNATATATTTTTTTATTTTAITSLAAAATSADMSAIPAASTSPAGTAAAVAIGAVASQAGRAWSKVATSLETLAVGPRALRRRGAEPVAAADGAHAADAAETATTADPIHHLTMKLTGAMPATAPGHPTVGLRIDQIAATLEQALRETAEAIPPVGRHAAEPAGTALEDPRSAEEDDPSMLLFAGPHSRLVVTTVQPGQALRTERHEADRIVLLLDGDGECVVDGLARMFTGADAQCVPAGTRHAIRNTGHEVMRIATVYAPAALAAA